MKSLPQRVEEGNPPSFTLFQLARAGLKTLIKGRVKPLALAMGIEAASLRLTRTYVLGYTPYMDTPSEHTLPRWTSTVSPALMDEFRHLPAAHRRSNSSELVWALEQSGQARAAEKETGC
jgi:hypothetical protein